MHSSSGFWLGVMSEKSLDYSDELSITTINLILTTNTIRSGLFEWEKPIIDKHFSNVKTILLLLQEEEGKHWP